MGGYDINNLLPNKAYFRLNKITPQGEQQVFGSGWFLDIPNNGTYKWYYVTSNAFDVNEGDQFVVKAQVGYNASGSGAGYRSIKINAGSSITFNQTTPPGVEVNGVNAVYAPYWSDVSHYPDQNFSRLKPSFPLRKLMRSGYVQNLDPLSSFFRFSPCTIPISDISKGDLIRFEYEKNQVYRVINGDIGSGSFNIDITPCLIPSGSVTCSIELNHFNIYRIVNNGSYIILDVPRTDPNSQTGTFTSGILQPEFSSEDLVNDYNKIVTTLTEKETIN
jgi:hypothetical protein